MAKRLNPKIIRVGDKVKIIKPLLFIRCGYKANIKDMTEKVAEEHRKEIVDFVCWLAGIAQETDLIRLMESRNPIDDIAIQKVAGVIAYELVSQARTTGAERKIYTKEDKSLEGEEYFVQAIMYVQTGIYNKGGCSPYSSNPYYGDDDVDYHYQPSFLENIKVHKILKLDQSWQLHCEELWIEAENVEKVYNKGEG